MKRTVFIMLVACTLSTMAAVPRLRRAINPDEQENETSTSSIPLICAPQTPCGWAVYKSNAKIITTNISNSYCTCEKGTICKNFEDDEIAGTFVLRCQKTPES